jgi:hypothetical protein
MNKEYNHWEYSKEEIEAMRERLAESEWEGLRDKDLKQVLWDGCRGWKHFTGNEILELHEIHFGEE